MTSRVGKPVCRRPVEDFLAGDGRLLAECFRDRRTPVAHTTDVDEGGEIAAKVDFGVFDRIHLVLRSVGLEPSLFSERQIDLWLLRLVPYVEDNFNLVEFGPRGTGKSYRP